MTDRRIKIGLVAVLAFALILLIGLPAAAASPSPDPAASPAASEPTPAPGATAPPCPNPTPVPTPTPEPTREGETPQPTPLPLPTQRPNLCPAVPGADPVSTIAWIFTPLFQAIFMLLAAAYNVTGIIGSALGSRELGDIGIAIIVVTLIIRVLLIPIFRRQIVSSRRMVALQPEMKALQQKYKGDRAKLAQEQQRLYKDRGVSPASGCLPALLTLFLLGPMYYVFTAGLQAPDISSMLTVFGVQVIHVTCQPAAATGLASCIDPFIPWLGFLPGATERGLNASVSEIFFTLPVLGFGVSLLALIAAFLQLIQTRMAQTNTSDPQLRVQNRTMLILPAISIIYGAFLPAGLFIYWITTTIFSIVQQYMIAGWGALFPLFGWNPAFARNHTPRYPVSPPPSPNTLSGGVAAAPARRTTTDSAAGTVKPSRQRARTSRRGRRR
ncbi:MAG: YidC/Oxa1 family membrane protein insertase [Candidatus Limnocylindrales bacterium]